VYVLWGSMLVTFAVGLYAIARGAVFEPPEFLTQLATVFERMSQRLQPT